MRRSDVKSVLAFLLTVVVVVATAPVLLAQEAETPEQEETITKPVTVGEIVVTAQKRTEDVQDVPMAVSTIDSEDMEIITAGAPDVRMLSARVPSLILESSFGRAFPRFYIRGLGNTDFDLNASQPVSMVVDEVVLENPVLKGMPLWDIERVEVARGPQGTLFGRNTPAGVVKFDTKKPTKDFDASFRVSYGSFDTMDVNGGVGGPIGDTASYRISALYQSRSDWVDNAHTGENNALGGYDTKAYRLQFMWEPTEDFTALLNVHGWDLDGTARIFRANIIKPHTNDLVDDFDRDTVYHDGLNEQDIEAQGGVLKLDYDFGGAVLTSVTSFETLEMYSRGDIDGGFGASFLGEGNYGPGFIPFASESADGLPDLDQFTQEIRLTSLGDGAFKWLVGVFYFNEDLQADSFGYDSLSPGNPQDGYAYQTQEADAYAIFATIDYVLSEQWDLQAGMRFSSDEKDFTAQRVEVPFIQNLLYGTLPSVVIERHVEDDNFSWNLSATYKAADNMNLYGRIATGFRAPSIQGRILWCADIDGTNPATNCVTTADTEEILSFEVGMKSILLDNRLRLNLTAYVYEVDGQQLTAVGGEYNTATLLNADTTEGHGFEADIEFIPSGNFLMTAGISYNPTKIKDDGLTVAPCGGGCTVTDPLTASGLALIDGNPLPHAPEWIANGIFTYRSDPGSKGIFGTLDVAYHSDKNFFLYESEEFHDDSFELGLRLGYGWNQGRYEVALFGRNITDEEVIEGGIDFNNLTGMMNEPRIIGVEFVGRF